MPCVFVSAFNEIGQPKISSFLFALMLPPTCDFVTYVMMFLSNTSMHCKDYTVCIFINTCIPMHDIMIILSFVLFVYLRCMANTQKKH